MVPRRLLFPMCAVVGLIGSTLPRSSAELTSTSPFLPPQGQAVTAPTAPPLLELRGITVVDGSTMFSIYDPTPSKKSGTWVKMNEAGHDFSVKKYDADNDTVTVDYQGRTLTLAMRTPKISSAGPAMMQALPQGNPQLMPTPPISANTLPVRPPGAIAPNPTPATEAARMADWAAEIEKRRQMRNQAPGMTTPPPAPVNVGNQGVRSQPPNSGGPQNQRSGPPPRRAQ